MLVEAMRGGSGAVRVFRSDAGAMMSEWFEAEQHVERAHEHFEAGRWEEAESELRLALSMNPQQGEWHFNLGLTLDAAGRHTDAASAFRAAAELDPEDPQPAIMTGLSHLRAGDPSASLEWFDKAERLQPESVMPYVHRIEAHATLGQHDQAELMFYMAQQIDPRSAEAFLAMADSLLDRSLHEKAVWCLREAAAIDEGLPGVQARLAHVYAATGRQERARQLYLRELRRDPGDIATLLDLGALLVEMNRFVEAGEKFRRVLEIEPDNADAHRALGDLAERLGNLDEAAMQMDVVMRLDPSYPGGRRRLASVLLRRRRGKDGEQATGLLAQELDDFRQNPALIVGPDREDLGRLLLDAQRPEDAAVVLGALANQEPQNPRAHHLLSVALLQSGRRAEGMEEARRVLRLDPRFVPAMHNLAMACIRERRWTRARYWLRQARAIDHEDASVRRLTLLLRLHAVGEGAAWVWCFLGRRRPK
jgi:tetratricopeptide (TPR) repeat protein